MSWQRRDTPAHRIPKASSGVMRLRHLAEQSEAAEEKMSELRPRFEAMRGEEKQDAKRWYQEFETPRALARRMVCMADIDQHLSVLEPSAGKGRLLEPMPGYADVYACEIQQCNRELITDLFPHVQIVGQDFMEVTGTYDRVVMNPPFYRGTDIKHVMHAYGLLKPGGKLVSLCYNGRAQNQILQEWVDSWEVLPAGMFKESGTGASVVLLTKCKE